MDRLRIAPFLMTLAALAGATPALPQGLPETAATLVAVSVELDGQAGAALPGPRRLGPLLPRGPPGLPLRGGPRQPHRRARGRRPHRGRPQRDQRRSATRAAAACTCSTPGSARASRAGAPRSRRCGSSRSWTSGPRTPRAPARPTRRWAGSRSRPTASAARSCARPRGSELPATRPCPSSRRATRPAGAQAPANEAARDSAEGTAPKRRGDAQARSYPGTGWGDRAHDPVVLVSFDPESEPSERVTLRYEYRPALVALGVLPRRVPPRDRLWERERAEPGFAQPPLW